MLHASASFLGYPLGCGSQIRLIAGYQSGSDELESGFDSGSGLSVRVALGAGLVVKVALLLHWVFGSLESPKLGQLVVCRVQMQ